MIRGAESSQQKFNGWHVTAIAACLLGAGCKQVIAAAPLVVLLYDRCFISGSFGKALRRAPWLYAGLALCWPAIGGLLLLPREDQSTGGGVNGLTRWDYLRSQAVVLAHYSRLAVWPWRQCFDYVWPVERDWSRILPCGIFVLGLLCATFWRLIRNAPQGVVGAWFFLILAPTSSFLPIADLACERRMYLSLAAIVVCIVFSLDWALQKLRVSRPEKLVAAVCLLMSAVLGTLTFQRNALYADIQAMWEDVLVSSPANSSALMTVGHCSIQKGDWAKARLSFERAVQVDPGNYATLCSLGKVLVAEKNYKEAAGVFQRAVENYPLGNRQVPALLIAEQNNKPFEPLEIAAREKTGDATLQLIYAARMLQENRTADAINGYRRAQQAEPENPRIALQLAWLLATHPNPKFRDGKAAVALAEKACALTQRADALALDTLAAAYAETGDFVAARKTIEEALRSASNNPALKQELSAHALQFEKLQALRLEP